MAIQLGVYPIYQTYPHLLMGIVDSFHTWRVTILVPFIDFWRRYFCSYLANWSCIVLCSSCIVLCTPFLRLFAVVLHFLIIWQSPPSLWSSQRRRRRRRGGGGGRRGGTWEKEGKNQTSYFWHLIMMARATTTSPSPSACWLCRNVDTWFRRTRAAYIFAAGAWAARAAGCGSSHAQAGDFSWWGMLMRSEPW